MLCFKCDQPYTPLHKYDVKSLRVTILVEYEDGLDEEDDGEGAVKDVGQTVMHGAINPEIELSMYAIGGISKPRTLKLKEKINAKLVVVMIDNEASHCFLSKLLVEEAGLAIMDTPPFGVCLGDGHRSVSQGMCKGEGLDLGTITVEVDGFLFGLGGVDVILGVSWLEQLGEVKLHWGK